MQKRVGAFTLSLDCEGLWGMADQTEFVNRGIVNSRTLKSAYDTILQTLSKNNLKATAAFVTCFAAEIEAVHNCIPIFERMEAVSPQWFENVLPVVRNRNFDGWNGNDFYRSMTAAGHEIAWHGTTHLPLSVQTPSEALDLELELTQKLLSTLGPWPRSIVFPRNKVGHLSLLRKQGFDTYRSSLPGGTARVLFEQINEWNIFDRRVAEMPRFENEWCVSPPGYFLNWTSGPRALVPVAVTVSRWVSLLKAAANSGGYVHMWFHPHNLITAPSMKIAFEEIMRIVGELVKSHDIINLTMADANDFYHLRPGK